MPIASLSIMLYYLFNKQNDSIISIITQHFNNVYNKKMPQQQPSNHRKNLSQIPTLCRNISIESNIEQKSLQYQRQSVTLSYKIEVFICSFLAYTSVHALRTTYSTSKSYLPEEINMKQELIGVVDSVMLVFIGLGNFFIAVWPLAKPIRALWLALLLCAVQYCFVPITMDLMTGRPAFAMLVLLMGLSGYLQSFTWPNLLPLVHSVCSPDKDTTLLGFWATCPNFGNIIGFVVMQLIVINNGYSWEFGMYIIAIYMAINAIYILIRIPQMPTETQPNKPPSLPPSQNSQSQPLLNSSQSQDNITFSRQQALHMKLKKQESAPPVMSTYSIHNNPSVIEVFKNSPRVTLLTISFSLIKSVMYGILLWLPAYFYSIGLVDYSLYIPMTFDAASIVGSTLLGAVFKRLQPSKKNIALVPVLIFLMIFFIMLKLIDFSVAGYFVIIAFVGLCLGGSYNTMAGLVTMQLVRAVPAELQTKYLRFYSALLMAIANIITGITQVIISYAVGEQQGTLFGIFVIYTAITVCSMSGVVIIEGILAKKALQDGIKASMITTMRIDESTLKTSLTESPKFKQIQFEKIN